MKLIKLGRHVVESDAPFLVERLGVGAKSIAANLRRMPDLLGQTAAFAEKSLIHMVDCQQSLFAVVSRISGNTTVVSDIGGYVLVLDPLNSVADLEVNGSVGTIFSIYPKFSGEALVFHGAVQLAAGYILYGHRTILVYTSGKGVNGFTLDPDIGEFLLTHQDIRTPPQVSCYSIKESSSGYRHEGLRYLIPRLRMMGKELCYTGSLVADFHRILISGGILVRSSDIKWPMGTTSLLYEAVPLAFIMEQAGGKATDGEGRILELPIHSSEQLVPFFAKSNKW